ncbi:stalk domain-containing protein [Paenibacillus nicotianae]|uniref:Stalk domain-containing protein n=1 Tax=Paenibacillus nicotianae TaxID=1526551 RepID=A0ABW4UTF1_9BACL
MNKKMIFSALLSSTLLLQSSLCNPVLASSSSFPTTYTFYLANNPKDFIVNPTMIQNGTIFVDIRKLAQDAGLTFAWDSTGQRASLNGFMKKVAIRLGSRTAMLDGKTVTLSAAPFKSKEKRNNVEAVYVPIRFAVQLLGGDHIQVDRQQVHVQARNIKSYNVITDVYQGSTYTLKKDGGDLYVAHGKKAPVKLVSLGINFDSVDMEFESTSGGLLILTINDAYGEPHIHNQQVKLIFQKGKLIRKAYADFTTINDSDITTYQGKIVLSDGKILRMIEDGTGNVVDQLDLVKLGGGSNEKYAVEALYDDAILMRTASKGRLLLIDRNTNQTITLYKELLDTSWQKQIGEDVDIDSFGSGDYMQFDKRVNDTFYFTFRAGSNQGKLFTYVLKS